MADCSKKKRLNHCFKQGKKNVWNNKKIVLNVCVLGFFLATLVDESHGRQYDSGACLWRTDEQFSGNFDEMGSAFSNHAPNVAGTRFCPESVVSCVSSRPRGGVVVPDIRFRVDPVTHARACFTPVSGDVAWLIIILWNPN